MMAVEINTAMRAYSMEVAPPRSRRSDTPRREAARPGTGGPLGAGVAVRMLNLRPQHTPKRAPAMAARLTKT
jgi:hypothetical protein